MHIQVRNRTLAATVILALTAAWGAAGCGTMVGADFDRPAEADAGPESADGGGAGPGTATPPSTVDAGAPDACAAEPERVECKHASDASVDAAAPKAARGISLGYNTACAVTTTDAVECWGFNGDGQFGSSTPQKSAVPVATSINGAAIANIAVRGWRHQCALTTAGAVLCWGENNYGQLGNGTTTDNVTPVAVSGLSSGVAAIAVGGFHTCALTKSGGVSCWGENTSGQLGNPASTGVLPLAVAGLSSGVIAIAAGYAHSCALTTAGAVKCWGGNMEGQLGVSGVNGTDVPTVVQGFASGATAIGAGEDTSCAIASGQLKCWGEDLTGGQGSSVPALIDGLGTGVTQVALSNSVKGHACALLSSGGVKCWGPNDWGQLGNGSTGYTPSAVAVTGLSSKVDAIAVGDGSSCAITQAGAVWCWGLNFSGQLGDGTKVDSDVPVRVSGY